MAELEEKRARHVDEVDPSLIERALGAVGLKLDVYMQEDESYCTRKTRVKISSKTRGEVVCGLSVDGQLKDPRQLGVAIDWVLRDKRCTHFLVVKPTSPWMHSIDNPFPKMGCDEAVEVWLDIFGEDNGDGCAEK